MNNMWLELRLGPKAPDIVYSIVETPKGEQNKTEYNINNGVLVLNRTLAASLHYPGDYGLIPQTWSEDDEPMDVLTMTGEPTFPGCVIQARPVGIFHLLDGDHRDDKVLAVVATDPLFAQYNALEDVPPHFLREVQHFFETYKDLEGGKRSQALGWEEAAAARQAILRAHQMFKERFGLQGL